jgi:hypothetical protein
MRDTRRAENGADALVRLLTWNPKQILLWGAHLSYDAQDRQR